MSKTSSPTQISTFVIIPLIAFFFFSYLSMAEETTKLQEPEQAAVQIVYVEWPDNEDPEAFHIRTLASVLGSEEAAKDALIYHYKHASRGFSAKLTPSQVEELKKKPGVLQVLPNRVYSLHGSSTGGGLMRV
ncbi:subtilisin-like protease SBT3.17 [Canna indica]|uniref:Subtilisin-like protease SBT3.17 n=1 Tax=Canna indica TaxID=4628 RepID=A0AAQ3QM95_9LILI|nr:subtilisin-like protease SBT3.17 [Canna indica]